MTHAMKVMDAVEAAIQELLENGEVVVRGLGHGYLQDINADQWLVLLRRRCNIAGVHVRFLVGRCECCMLALLDPWEGEMGPLRIMFEAHDIAAVRAARAEEASREQWDRLMNTIQGIEP